MFNSLGKIVFRSLCDYLPGFVLSIESACNGEVNQQCARFRFLELRR